MFKKLFSQRNGYSDVDNIIVRERITVELQNAICNSYDDFKSTVVGMYTMPDLCRGMEEYLWRYFLNEKLSDFSDRYDHYKLVLRWVILDKSFPWYKKLDVIESSLDYLYSTSETYPFYRGVIDKLVESLNFEFKRLSFAYRIINKQIVEVTTEEEIVSIKKALQDNNDSVREHLTKAMELCSKRPLGDYRNSIKESISAVEYICRKKTGENDLGKGLSKLEKKGVIIPNILKKAFDTLYAYTNDKVTGIRHALMDEDGTYAPGVDEAIFMLVSCSAFINYLNKK